MKKKVSFDVNYLNFDHSNLFLLFLGTYDVNNGAAKIDFLKVLLLLFILV